MKIYLLNIKKITNLVALKQEKSMPFGEDDKALIKQNLPIT